MITLQPLIGISIMPSPLSDASGIECFKLVSTNNEIAEVARKQDLSQQLDNSDSMEKAPKREQERTLGRGLPTPSLSPKMPRM